MFWPVAATAAVLLALPVVNTWDWASEPPGPRHPARVTKRPWDLAPATDQPQLPAFFREDNLRQIRLVLSEVARSGALERARPGTPLHLPEDLEEIACAEQDRWVPMRLAHGWRKVDGPDDRDDGRRLHHLVIPYRGPGVSLVNADGQVRETLRRLHATGLAPVPQGGSGDRGAAGPDADVGHGRR